MSHNMILSFIILKRGADNITAVKRNKNKEYGIFWCIKVSEIVESTKMEK